MKYKLIWRSICNMLRNSTKFKKIPNYPILTARVYGYKQVYGDAYFHKFGKNSAETFAKAFCDARVYGAEQIY